MRIAFVTDSYMQMPGVGLVPDPFRQGVIDGLQRLGHEVSLFISNGEYFEDRGFTPRCPDAGARLARDIGAVSPDLVLSINRAGFCPEVLDLRGPRFASWYIDNVHTFPPELLRFGERELVFFFGPRSASEPDGAPAGLPMSRRFYLPLGVDHRAFQPRADLVAQVGYRFNIVFMGGFFSSMVLWRLAQGKNPAYYQRLSRLYDAMPAVRSYAGFEALLEAEGLAEPGERERRHLLYGLLASWTGMERVRKLEAVHDLGLTLYGGNWEAMIPEHMALLRCFAGGSITRADMLSQLLSVSRMTVNITHIQSRLCGGLNLRVYEALSAGTLLINDHPDEIGAMFEDGAEFLSYRDEAALRERCAWALAEPGEARRIAENGRRAVLSGHTLQHRLATLLSIVEES